MSRLQLVASKLKLLAHNSTRSIGISRRIGAQSEKERLLQIKYRIPEEFQLIYRAPMQNYMSVAKNVSTLSASLIAILAAVKLASDKEYLPIKEFDFLGLVSQENDIWIFGAGFIAINLAIRAFVSRYPLRIYKATDRYIAVFDSQLPFQSTVHQFKRGQVAEMKHVLNPWNDATYRLGTRTSLLMINYFKTPSEFHEMCLA